jgi:hypothetical protein
MEPDGWVVGKQEIKRSTRNALPDASLTFIWVPVVAVGISVRKLLREA